MDRVVYSGANADYSISETLGVATDVAGDPSVAGRDRLDSIEILEFDDAIWKDGDVFYFENTRFDTEETRPGTSITETFGAGRVLTDKIGRFDDGRLADADYNASGALTQTIIQDISDVKPWYSITRTYDPSTGALISTEVVDDSEVIPEILL